MSSGQSDEGVCLGGEGVEVAGVGIRNFAPVFSAESYIHAEQGGRLAALSWLPGGCPDFARVSFC
jgi:hypothetical protein